MIDWNEYFYYDETSPSCLRWKVDMRAGMNYNVILKPANSAAGSLFKPGKSYQGVYRVGLNNKNYEVHRVIWELLVNKISDGFQIDHIDGNGLNNKIVNLRLVDNTINSRNQRMRSHNTSGVNGVYKYTHKNGTQYWVAQWYSLDKLKKSKFFSCKKFGEEGAFELACQYREQMFKELNMAGAGYTERHGK